MKRVKPWLGVAGIVLGLMSTVGVTEPALAHAATSLPQTPREPQVLAAWDATSAHCFYTLHNGASIACPSGSIVNTQGMSLAEAQAHHLAYIVIPAGTTELTGALQAQADGLVEKVREDTRAKANLAITQSVVAPAGYWGCGHGGTSPLVDWYPNWGSGVDTSIEFESTVTYSVSSDCNNVTITDSQIYTLKSSSSTYWLYDMYAGSRWSRACASIPSNTPNHRGLLSTQPAGYTWQQYVSSGCAWYYASSYFDVWRLN